MEDLNSHKDRLEANLLALNKFEGLEGDLIQQHGNLRVQFSEYRDAIESSINLTEQEKREHFNHHDELIKRLHKLVLEAKALTRKRTEQMTRDELFKLSQERQKNLKPQTAEDKIGEEVTKSLKRMLETMRTEVERSSSNISTAHSTTKQLEGTSDNYQKLSGTLDESRSLIRDLWKKNRNDMIYIFGALGIFVATAAWVIVQRTPGAVWVPGRIILNQLANLIPKSGEKIAKVAESIFSDNEESSDAGKASTSENLFIDSIPKPEADFGNDDLLKVSEEEASAEFVSDKGPDLVKNDLLESSIAENVPLESNASDSSPVEPNITDNAPLESNIKANSPSLVEEKDTEHSPEIEIKKEDLSDNNANNNHNIPTEPYEEEIVDDTEQTVKIAENGPVEKNVITEKVPEVVRPMKHVIEEPKINVENAVQNEKNTAIPTSIETITSAQSEIIEKVSEAPSFVETTANSGPVPSSDPIPKNESSVEDQSGTSEKEYSSSAELYSESGEEEKYDL